MFIEKYGGYELHKSTRHGKAVKGTKITSSVQIRDYDSGLTSGEDYLLVKQIPYKVGVLGAYQSAIKKAKDFIDFKIKEDEII